MLRGYLYHLFSSVFCVRACAYVWMLSPRIPTPVLQLCVQCAGMCMCMVIVSLKHTTQSFFHLRKQRHHNCVCFCQPTKRAAVRSTQLCASGRYGKGRLIACGIAMGLAYLHADDIIHFDIKCKCACTSSYQALLYISKQCLIQSRAEHTALQINSVCWHLTQTCAASELVIALSFSDTCYHTSLSWLSSDVIGWRRLICYLWAFSNVLLDRTHTVAKIAVRGPPIKQLRFGWQPLTPRQGLYCMFLKKGHKSLR